MVARVLRIIFAGSALAVIAACGGSSDNTGPSPVFSAVSLTPPSPSLAVGATVTMVAIARDQNGATLTGLPPATFSSSDTTKLTVGSSTGVATGVAAGSATITGMIVSGSITHSGTQTATVTAPSSTATVTATSTLAFVPPVATITAGGGTGTVTWHFQTVAHTVTWDGVPSGATAPADIPATSSADSARTFTTHGSYFYHCSIHPSMTGKVTVN